MLLSKILNGICDPSAYPDQEIREIRNDSRAVRPGDLFVCIKGAAVDGHNYAESALQKGAAAIVVERDLGLYRQIIVPDTHKAYAKMASNYYGNPAKEMKLVGITGTNGKTTCTILVKSILKQLGKKVGLIGTIRNEIGDEILPTEKTTPDALELEELYRKMVDASCEYCVMEVSSHALDQQRIGESHYEVGVFTNLTQDHLDYHLTMEDYFAAKVKLFSICESAVINLDDEYGKRLLALCTCPTTTFSTEDPSADLFAHDIRYHADSVNFSFTYQGIVSKVHFGMPGVFSVKNALTALAVALRLGVSLEKAIDGIESADVVPGRSEIISQGLNLPFVVVRDYAHSPDGLENVLPALKATCKGELIVLFGCGGDRDKTKRPKMGAAAARYADRMIVTSDNPRTEEPQAIIDDILPGLAGTDTPYEVIVNRKEAIAHALQIAKENDTVVLAGKGHEDYQIIGTEKFPFDEREIVRELVLKMQA